MIPARWIAVPLVALTGCATMTGTSAGPRLLAPDMHIGALDQRTRFELDDRGPAPASERSAPDDRVDTPKKERRRKILYFTGLGALGFGVVGTLGFGIGGRIVQAQMKNGYEDGTLTRDREDQLSTTGKVMNGLAIGSAVVGLLGVITAAAVYGVDHSRCGDLPPRRKSCDGKASETPETSEAAAPDREAPLLPGDGPSQAEEPSPAEPGPEPGPAPGPEPEPT